MREGGRTRFMAPELLAGAEKFRTSPASDIFSLWECLDSQTSNQ
jgi:hypothetical protein